MSDAPDREEKVHDPSPRRLQKAREDGNVATSKDATGVALLLASGAVLLAGMPAAFGALQDVLRRAFLGAAAPAFDVLTVQDVLVDVGLRAALVVLPLFGVLMVAGVGASVAQTGGAVSGKLLFKPDRLSPAQGLKRLASARGLVETLKAVLKVALITPLVYGLLKGHLDELLTLHTLPLTDALAVAGSLVGKLLVQVLLALALVAGADYGYQRWKWKADLKMTFKEVKDEGKDQEGDPHVKGRRREAARARMRRPSLAASVLQADVVVTNPTHFAVALRYAPDEAAAPRVLVKGTRLRALRIKELAAEAGVPRVENVPLARALFAGVEEGGEIPEALYAAVAAVLAEVFRTREAPSVRA